MTTTTEPGPLWTAVDAEVEGLRNFYGDYLLPDTDPPGMDKFFFLAVSEQYRHVHTGPTFLDYVQRRSGAFVREYGRADVSRENRLVLQFAVGLMMMGLLGSDTPYWQAWTAWVGRELENLA